MSETVEIRAEHAEIAPEAKYSYSRSELTVTLEVSDYGELVKEVPIPELIKEIDQDKILDAIGVEKVKDYFGLVDEPEVEHAE